MQDDDETDMLSLNLAYNFSSDQIPTNFIYSSLLFFVYNGITKNAFKTNSYSLACGTIEGVILIVSANNYIDSQLPKIDNSNKQSSLQKIALLCSHEYTICSMIQTLDEHSFLSISKDGTICRWSLDDFSCIFTCNLFSQRNEYKLILSWKHFNKVWILSLGIGIYLFDLNSQSIIQTIEMSGIESFCILYSQISPYVNNEIAIALNFQHIITYQLNEQNSIKMKDKHQYDNTNSKFFLLEYGIIKYIISDTTFSIFNPETLTDILTWHIDLDENDSVSDIQWRFQKAIIISTGRGTFYIVNISNDTKTDYKVESIHTIETNLYCRHFACSGFTDTKESIQIAFSPNSKKIVYLDVNNDASFDFKTFMLNTNNSRNIVCKSPLVNEQSYFLLRKPTDIDRIDLKTNTIINTFHYNTKITSMLIDTNKLADEILIITGHSNGDIKFIFQSFNFITLNALTDAIIGIIKLPTSNLNDFLYLAISANSACIFTQNNITLRFLCSQHRIVSVLFFNDCLLIEHINGLIEAFSFSSNQPVSLFSDIPKDALYLWKYFNSNIYNQKDEKKINKMVKKEIASNSFFYSFYDINFLLEEYEKQQNKSELLKVVKEISLLKFDSKYSYVLIGNDGQSQTFFYNNVFESTDTLTASERIKANLYLIKVILQSKFKIDISYISELDKSYVPCFPIFVELLQKSTHSYIRELISSVCFDLMNYFTLISSRNLVQVLTVNNNELINDSLSTCISLAAVTTKFPVCIHPEIIKPLFKRLLKFVTSSSIESEIIIYCFLANKAIWLKQISAIRKTDFESAQGLFYRTILVLMVKQQRRMNFLKEIFQNDVLSNVDLYCANLISLIDIRELDEIEKMIIMLVSITIEDPINSEDLLVHIFELWSNPKLSDIISAMLPKYASRKNISYTNNFMLVGLSNGNVFIFSKGKKSFNDHVFKSKIDIASIGPNAKYCVIVSNIEKKICKYQIRIKQIQKKIELINSIISDSKDHITDLHWNSEDEYVLHYS